MKLLTYPKKLKFPEGISSGAIYSFGLSTKQVEKLQKLAEEKVLKASTLIIDDSKEFDKEWTTNHCGNSDVAILVFTDKIDPLNIILLASDYYTKFFPTTFIVLDDSLSSYNKELVEWYAGKCKLNLYSQKDFDKICKMITPIFSS